jgi:hypothetical protein
MTALAGDCNIRRAEAINEASPYLLLDKEFLALLSWERWPDGTVSAILFQRER